MIPFFNMNSTTNIRYLLLITFVAALGGLLFGFDIAIITGAAPFIRDFFELTDLTLGASVSALLWGCIFGAAIAGRITDLYGRRKILILVALLFALTSFGTGIAPTIRFFMIARFMGGFAVGAASIISPMYISEIAPSNIRGRLVAVYQLSIVVGILISYFINYLLHDIGSDNWRWMFYSGVIPSLLFLILLFIVPDTPRYLILKNEKDLAFKVLKRINGKEKASVIMKEIIESIDKRKVTFRELLQPGYKKMMFVGFWLAVFVQFSGINTIIDYAPIILESAGWKISAALFSTFIIGFVNLLFTLVSIWAIDRIGRRPLYIIGSAGMTLILSGLTLANWTGHFEGPLVLMLIILYIAFFAACIGPVFWTLVAEIFPNRIRGTAMSVPVFTQWIANAIVVMVFPWMLSQTGGTITFGILFFMALLMLLFTIKYVPETKGKTLEEIEKYWNENR